MNTDEFPTFEPGQFLEGTAIELRNPSITTGKAHFALFDFDGTLSLIRTGWQDVMMEMMVDVLSQCATEETPESLARLVSDYVDRLTGKQTIYQMIRLAEEVKKRGGKPEDPLQYKRRYHDRLMRKIAERRESLRSGGRDPDDFLMPGSRQLLRKLCEAGLSLYLASGTDLEYVREEAELLKIADFFDGRIYAAVDRVEDFSKAQVLRQIFSEHSLQGPELLSFGDGYVEILNTRQVGGIAIGVASDEFRPGRTNEWKRNRLIQAGADLIIPGFGEQEELLSFLLSPEYA